MGEHVVLAGGADAEAGLLARATAQPGVEDAHTYLRNVTTVVLTSLLLTTALMMVGLGRIVT